MEKQKYMVRAWYARTVSGADATWTGETSGILNAETVQECLSKAVLAIGIPLTKVEITNLEAQNERRANPARPVGGAENVRDRRGAFDTLNKAE